MSLCVTALAPRAERPGVQGHLQLLCAVDAHGRSYLGDQSFCVPFHLSKPFSDAGVLVLNVINPTAGLFRGDTMRSQIEVSPHARLLLTSPSAMRVHDTAEGRAESVQSFRVRANSWLEVLPELFIPHRGAIFRQQSSIEIEPGGELLYLEMLAPGRVAAGESFNFTELDWSTEVRYDGRLVVREKYVLSPQNGSLASVLRFSEHPYIGTFFIITHRLQAQSACWREVDGLHSAGLWIGSSQLAAGGWVIKMIAETSDRLRQAVARVRKSVYTSAGWGMPAIRKL